MPRVQAQADERRIGAFHQRIDLSPGFHERAAVGMEHGPHSGPLMNPAGDFIGAASEHIPLRRAEAVGIPDPSRDRDPPRIPVRHVGQDDEGLGITGVAEKMCGSRRASIPSGCADGSLRLTGTNAPTSVNHGDRSPS